MIRLGAQVVVDAMLFSPGELSLVGCLGYCQLSYPASLTVVIKIVVSGML